MEKKAMLSNDTPELKKPPGTYTLSFLNETFTELDPQECMWKLVKKTWMHLFMVTSFVLQCHLTTWHFLTFFTLGFNSQIQLSAKC